MPLPLLYGFMSLSEDVLSQRLAVADIPVINTAVDAALARHTTDLNLLMGLFVSPVTKYKERHRSIGADMLQPLDEYGRALPVKGGVFQDVSYPLQRAGTALGLTYEAREKMTVRELNDQIAGRTMADARWMRYHIIGALLAENGWTFVDDEHGELSIKGLANGDNDTYLIQEGNENGAVADHYLAQAAAISDAANPFASDYELLMGHPENSGEAVALISTNLKASVEGLADFTSAKDVNVQVGSNEKVLIGQIGIPHPGKLIGYVNNTFIVEWKGMPASTIIGVATEGERALGERQDETPSLQGFKRVGERNDHPYYESQYLRKAGFGGRNRVGAYVRRIGMANYAIPAGFESPMP